jgi:signal peptidase II
VKVLKENGSIPILKNIFELTYVENRGAAFGILQNCQWLFVVLTAVVLAVLFWFFFRMPEGRRYLPARLCLTGLAAGAVGNLIDRVVQGYVVDFFYFKLIDFPVFNMADIYVVVTILILAVLILFYYDEDEFSQKQ